MNYPSRGRITVAALSLWIGLRLLLNEGRFINENNALDGTTTTSTRKTQQGRKSETVTSGFVVLGMHRSGTSLLTGLLSQGFGYDTGGPLLGANVSCIWCFVWGCLLTFPSSPLIPFSLYRTGMQKDTSNFFS